MSSTNRRFIIAYILLVGLPLAGLAGVLRAGRHLAAPISIEGSWKIEASASRPVALPCDHAVASLLNSTLFVSQSGKTLELTLNGISKTVVPGQLEGRQIRASLGVRAGCPADQRITLKASIGPETEPNLLTGSLSVENCPLCSPFEFRAVRQPKNQGGGGH